MAAISVSSFTVALQVKLPGFQFKCCQTAKTGNSPTHIASVIKPDDPALQTPLDIFLICYGVAYHQNLSLLFYPVGVLVPVPEHRLFPFMGKGIFKTEVKPGMDEYVCGRMQV